MAKCYISDKKKFKTREDAQSEQQRIEKINPSNKLRIYCCEFCNTWHFTHKKRYDW